MVLYIYNIILLRFMGDLLSSISYTYDYFCVFLMHFYFQHRRKHLFFNTDFF
uniref:Uncharacterized protein n=1 Tax=Heterorhabditis bacteriophora TaxID=37862 RepID=A0A1I7WNC3_HETBA